MPHLEGTLAFQLRVAANAIELARREISVPVVALEEQRELLQSLLRLKGGVDELSAELAARIADGRIDAADSELETVLWHLTCAKLGVDQPAYAGLQRALALRGSEPPQRN